MNLTTTEKKELKIWAANNGIDLSYNKKLEFGNGFWPTTDIADLKAALMGLENSAALRLMARNAVGVDYVAVDVLARLGDKKGFTLFGHDGQEIWVKDSSIVIVNGFSAVPANYFK